MTLLPRGRVCSFIKVVVVVAEKGKPTRLDLKHLGQLHGAS